MSGTLLKDDFIDDIGRYGGRLEIFAGDFQSILARQIDDGA